ncbi:MAG: PQQ-binding-like beta-propeller repeat protein, partial [Planctomycetota bacterium]
MRCVLPLLLTAPLVAQDQDWPTHRADLARSGRTHARLDVTRLRPIWTHRARRPPRPAWPGPARWDAFAGLAGLASMRNYDPVFHPIAVGQRVWFGSSSEDTVVCLDASSGSVLWEFVTGGPVRVAPTWDAGRLYVGSDDGSAICLDAASGELLWRFDPTLGSRRVLNNGRLISAWPVRTGVAVEDGTAYFAASMLPWQVSYVCAVDALSGEPTGDGHPRYVRDLGTGWTMEGATALSSTALVIPQGRVAPLLFDRETGASRGTLQGGGGSFCLVTEDDAVLHGPGNKSGWITDSRESTGEAIASYERGNAIVIGAQGAFLLSDQTLGALDRTTGSVLWSVPTQATLTMVLAGEHLILGGDGRVEARLARDGRLLWEASVEGRAHGLAVARGRLLVATDLGRLTAFEASGEPLVVRQPEPGEAEGRVLGAPPVIDAQAGPGLLDRWLFQSDAVVLQPPLGADPTDAARVPHVRNQAPGGLAARVLGALDLR